MAERRWFGQALHWGRERGTWYAEHAGRRYPLARITRAEADTYEDGTRPGWHLAEHPDTPGHGALGPWLAPTIGGAKEMAEAWILCPGSDRAPATYAPNVILALRDVGAVFVDAGGRTLSAHPIPWETCVEIRNRRGEAVGRVGPWFHSNGDGDVTALKWIGKVGETRLAPQPTFHAVCTEFGRVLAFGAAGGDDRG